MPDASNAVHLPYYTRSQATAAKIQISVMVGRGGGGEEENNDAMNILHGEQISIIH